jgi:hypothetical protein
MTTDRDRWADNLSGDNAGGWLTGFLAEESEFDRRSLWRLGSWGVGSVAAVVVALLVGQFGGGLRRDQDASADLVRQSQQIQWVAKESQNETRRLAAAIDTLNTDRDRLYSRVTVLEQGLDSVTGSIVRQSTTAASPVPSASSVPSAPLASTSTPSASNPSSSASVAATPAPKPVAEPPAAPQASAPSVAPSPTVSQNNAAPAVPAAATTAATDKPSTVAALSPGPPATLPPVPAPIARPEPTNDASQAAIFAPAAASPASTLSLIPARSFMAPPDAAATRLSEPDLSAGTAPAIPPPQVVAAAPATTEPDKAETRAPAAIAVRRTEFGIDLGGANSIDGLRALWRGLLKSKSNKALAELQPIIVVKERSNGLGMQLRLVAGPLSDAATAARICATLTESDRSCETTIFDGQRLAIKADNSPSPAAPPAISNAHSAPASTKWSHRRGVPKGANKEEPAAAAPAEPPKSSLTSLLGMH